MHSINKPKVRATDVEYVYECERGPTHVYRRIQPRLFKNIIPGLLVCTCVSLFTLVACRSLLFPNTHLVPVPSPNTTSVPLSLSPCQTQVTPTITPELFSLENLYNNTIEQYCQLIQQMKYKDAYKILATTLQGQLPLSQFVSNHNYIVLEKRWLLYQIVASQPLNGSKSWVVEALLKATECSLAETVWYNWEIFLSLQGSHAVITSMTLHHIEADYLPKVSC